MIVLTKITDKHNKSYRGPKNRPGLKKNRYPRHDETKCNISIKYIQ